MKAKFKNRNNILMFFFIIICIIMVFGVKSIVSRKESKETMSHVEKVQKPLDTQKVFNTPKPSPNLENDIYTYLQGPKSWKRKLKWSGKWGVTFMDGGSFGGFGCGLCCIANIYSSLGDYRCTPVDAYRFAKKKTGYSGGGAIEWGYMRRTLSKAGFECGVKKKPATYKEFQKEIKANKGTVALVSSADSKCYWKDTPGHYVTLFLYNDKTDKVFLGDSGDPNHNRKWISLKKIYQSLKTESNWQYLSVIDYNVDKDQWKNKKMTGKWTSK